jgi:hypothetical protein
MTQILLYPWASLTVERMQQETPVLLHEMFDLEDKAMKLPEGSPERVQMRERVRGMSELYLQTGTH